MLWGIGPAGCTRPPAPGGTVVVEEEVVPDAAAAAVAASAPEPASLDRVPAGACRVVADRICGEFGLSSPQCRALVEETSAGTAEVTAGCERALPELDALVELMRRAPDTTEVDVPATGSVPGPGGDDPCAVLAEWFCETVGPTSEDCVRAQAFSRTRGAENAAECRELLRQATEPVPGGPVAGLPDDVEAEALARPCHAVADRTCAELGDTNPVCREMRSRLDGLQPADERACRELLPRLDEVIRVFRETERNGTAPLP